MSNDDTAIALEMAWREARARGVPAAEALRDARVLLAELAAHTREFQYECRHRDRAEARARKGPAWLRNRRHSEWGKGKLVDPTPHEWINITQCLGRMYIFQFDHGERTYVSSLDDIAFREPVPELLRPTAVLPKPASNVPKADHESLQGRIFWAVCALLFVVGCWVAQH